MRVLLILCSTFCISLPIFAGTTGKITGQITDEHGAPLPGASVTLEGTRRGSVTDESGVYFILSVEPGRYNLVASMIGYNPQRQESVLITSDFTTNHSFQLKEQALNLGEIVVEAQSGEPGGWGMFSTKATAPPIEPDRTTTIYTVRSEDIEAIPIIRQAQEFIELQAGVSIDENGDEITIRAGDSEDVAYYLDGVPIPSTDHAQTRVYRDFNRLSIQEMTIVTGGMNAEYGNAQGGIVQVVIKEGSEQYHGLVDYQITPPGKKHWGANAYDSPIHRDHNRWDDPEWVSETVTLPDGREVQAHKRRDYTGVTGHFLEGNLSGPLKKDLTFFLSSRWRNETSALPNADQTTPPNINTTGKVSYHVDSKKKLIFGGLFDRRQTPNNSPDIGGTLDLRDDGRNLFLADQKSTGDGIEIDHTFYAGFTHLLSKRTFYDIRLSHSVSKRDTLNVRLPDGIKHISEAWIGDPIKDQEKVYTVFREAVEWERYNNNRLTLKADLSSQINKYHFLKSGVELIRFNNWYQSYRTADDNRNNDSGIRDQTRRALWYGKTYNDTDFFPDRDNTGVNPIRLVMFLQDKIELNGMIINAGLRYNAFFHNAWVRDVGGFYGANGPGTGDQRRLSTMWHSMTLARNMPMIKGPTITAIEPRIGVSHPLGERSVIRFFYGRFTQFPAFADLYLNTWYSGLSSDTDLNQNSLLDSGERWNEFRDGTTAPNPFLSVESTNSIEVGADFNIAQDYVFSMTTYYKSTNGNITNRAVLWRHPITIFTDFNNTLPSNTIFRDTRGIEINLKKRFSQMFAFNFAFNLQWAEQGNAGLGRLDIGPDSLFIARGHFWTQHDVDPVTGAEIPVSLEEQARREDKDPDHYIKFYGHLANELLRELWPARETSRELILSKEKGFGHYAAEGIPVAPGQFDTSLYSDEDRIFWERINSSPTYPGTGEGNLIVVLNQEFKERTSSIKDRRSFGSFTFLFATPPTFGPLKGRALGGLRANLVYRFYTGTPYEFIPLVLDPLTGRSSGGAIERDYGPIHTRTDLNLEKQFGNPQGFNIRLGVEIYNLFNQKDARSVPPHLDRPIDFDAERWRTWGILGLEPNASNGFAPREINDINNYWDSPREMKFSVRVKW